jgi:hypothetical protein
MSLIGKILGAAAAPAIDYLKARQELRSKERIRKEEIKDARHARQLELERERAKHTAEWELEQIRNSGWKDEYVLISLSIPLVGCFVPGVDVYILRGFAVLEKTPEWFQWLILTVYAAIYGIRLTDYGMALIRRRKEPA